MDDYENHYLKKDKEDEGPPDRRNNSRRKKESKGYLYISMVGWMDRREYGRRSEDEIMFQ